MRQCSNAACRETVVRLTAIRGSKFGT